MQTVNRRKRVAGVVGGATVDSQTYETAVEVGSLLARQGYTVVCGGLSGVMEGASKGAVRAGGDVIGVLPGPGTDDANAFVTHPVATNMGHARNVIIAHSADFLVAIGGETGTLSEIALALKLGKSVYSLGSWEIAGVTRVESVERLESELRLAGFIGEHGRQ